MGTFHFFNIHTTPPPPLNDSKFLLKSEDRISCLKKPPKVEASDFFCSQKGTNKHLKGCLMPVMNL